MTEPVRWRSELTGERLPAIAQQLEWALQHQQRRYVQRLPMNRIPDRQRAWMARALSAAIVVLVLALVRLDPSIWDEHRLLVTGMFALAAIGFVLSFAFPQTRAWSRRYAGRSIARRAARLLRPLARRLPAAFDYELWADRIVVHWAGRPLLNPIPLEPGLVLAAPDALFVFRKRSSLGVVRTVYVPAGPERRAVLDAFARAGAEQIELTGPAEGYADRVPPARAL